MLDSRTIASTPSHSGGCRTLIRPQVQRTMEQVLLRFMMWHDPCRGPLDRALRAFYSQHRQLGARDRSWLAERLFWHEKRRLLCDALFGDALEERAQWVAAMELPEEPTLPPSVTWSTPHDLWAEWAAQGGVDFATQQAAVAMEQAPLYLRVNPLVTDRATLLTEIPAAWGAQPCAESLLALELPPLTSVTSHPRYQEGAFEIQDLGSQHLAHLVQAKPGDEVLDFCAGSGGKALAIAGHMQGRGQVHLYDLRASALRQARIRCRRARAQNVQFHEASTLRYLRGRCDWVLVDAPCSGTGTLRRNPEMKWRFTQQGLLELVQLQREILLQAAQYLCPQGRLVYGTCSTLEKENIEQRRWMEEQGWTCEQTWHSTPSSGHMDGFFGMVLHRAAPRPD